VCKGLKREVLPAWRLHFCYQEKEKLRNMASYFVRQRCFEERPDKEDSSRQFCQHLGRSMDWGLELYEALNENGRCECGART
jgi:hypothetical protein